MDIMVNMNQKGFAHLLLLLVLILGLVILLYLVQSKQLFNFKPKATEQSEAARLADIDKLTTQLIQAQSAKPGYSIQGDQITQMVDLAKQRQKKLIQEMGKNPANFLKHATLTQSAGNFPASVQPFLEQDATASGELSVVHIDRVNQGASKLLYLLKAKSRGFAIQSEAGKPIYAVYFSTAKPALRTGDEIEVRGVSLGSQITVKDITVKSKSSIRAMGEGIREETTAVILINFESDQRQAYPKDQVQAWFFSQANSVANYFQINSKGKSNFSGQIYGYVTIPDSAFAEGLRDCQNRSNQEGDFFGALLSAAENTARQANIPIDQYQHRVYMFPPTDECGFSGLGELGGKNVWIIRRGERLELLTHELGHNLNMMHADTYNCRPNIIDVAPKCYQVEYGDFYDVMGGGLSITNPYAWKTYHLNAPHKIQLGWIDSSAYQQITADGSYRVYNIEDTNLSAGIKQALLIAKSDTNETYYIEYRKPNSFSNFDPYDRLLPKEATKGVLIHVWNKEPWNNTKLLDMTPGSINNGWTPAVGGDDDDFVDSSLYTGNSFYDPINRIAIRQINQTKDYVDLEIKFNAPPPPPAPRPRPYLEDQWNVYQGLIDKDGKTSWARTCPLVDGNLSCTSRAPTILGWKFDLGPVNLSNLPALDKNGADLTVFPNGVSAYAAYSFMNNDKWYAYQGLIDQDGKTSWARTCPIVDGNLNCPARGNDSRGNPLGWKFDQGPVNLSNIPAVDKDGKDINIFPDGVRAYATYSFLKDNQWYVYQGLVGKDGKTAWSRTCSITNGNLDCPARGNDKKGNPLGWKFNEGPVQLVNLPAVDSNGQNSTVFPDGISAYAAYSFMNNDKWYVYQGLIDKDGKTSWARTCPVTNGNLDCPARKNDKQGNPLGWKFDLGPVNLSNLPALDKNGADLTVFPNGVSAYAAYSFIK